MPQFTRKAIMESFIKLLNEQPLNKITVKKIVDDCGINRNTFYYHFEDIYSLIKAIFNEAVIQSPPINWEDYNWDKNFSDLMQFATENKRLLQNIYTSMNRELLTKYIAEISELFVDGLVHYLASDTNASEEDINAVVQLQTYTIAGVIEEWLANGMSTKPNEKVFTLWSLFAEGITHQLKTLGSM